MRKQLVPAIPRRMRQPKKDVLRDQLVLAAEEIERLRGELLRRELQRARRPWWRRVFGGL